MLAAAIWLHSSSAALVTSLAGVNEDAVRAAEVAALMRLFREYLRAEVERCIRNGVRLEVVGRRDRLDDVLRSAVEATESATRNGGRLLLRIAIDYSARDAILRYAALVGEERLDRQSADQLKRLR